MIPIHINRHLGPGRYAVDEVFRGLEDSPGMKLLMPKKGDRESILSSTYILIVAEDMYMWTDDEDGHVNIGLEYLMKGEEVYLYLDILHELVHVRQFKEGKELFDRSYKYVDRPTEVEAYDYVVHEARRLGLSDEKIYDYLQVEWITKRQHDKLAKRLGVRVAQGELSNGG